MSATRGMADGPRFGCGSHRCLEQEPGRWVSEGRALVAGHSYSPTSWWLRGVVPTCGLGEGGGELSGTLFRIFKNLSEMIHFPKINRNDSFTYSFNLRIYI